MIYLLGSSLLIGFFSGYSWTHNPVQFILFLPFLIPFCLILLMWIFKRNGLKNLLLFILVAMFSTYLYTQISYLRAEKTLAEFVTSFETIQYGMSEVEVSEILGEYIIHTGDRRWAFRSLPNKNKTYFHLKGAYIDFCKQKLVEDKAIYIPN